MVRRTKSFVEPFDQRCLGCAFFLACSLPGILPFFEKMTVP